MRNDNRDLFQITRSTERYDDVNDIRNISQHGLQIEDYKGGIVVFAALLDQQKKQLANFLKETDLEIWKFITNSNLLLILQEEQKEIMIMNLFSYTCWTN